MLYHVKRNLNIPIGREIHGLRVGRHQEIPEPILDHEYVKAHISAGDIVAETDKPEVPAADKKVNVPAIPPQAETAPIDGKKGTDKPEVPAADKKVK